MKKEKVITIVSLAILLIMLVGGTYAFFRGQLSGTSTHDISVTSNTTDNLSFQIGSDISFTVSEANFYQGGNNVSGNTTATAILTPNNKTNQASMNYYMYLNLTSNPTVYSTGNTNHDAELMLQVYNGSNQLVTLSGLGTQKTVNGVTGYDITGRQGLITLLDNHTITANNATTTENWSIVITLINLNIDQLDNTNKVITGEVILRKDAQLDTTRLAAVVPQTSNDTTKGYVETVIEPSLVTTNNVEEEIYTIYTVGYITDDSITGTTYSIDIQNMGIDFSNYDLELVGTPQVMTTQADYTNYVAMKTNGLPLTSLSNGDTTKANATAQELYTYSLNASELTINNVHVYCSTTKCTATITETFSNISGKSKHSTTNSNNEAINVIYNGIKFNLKKKSTFTGTLYRHNSNKTSTNTSILPLVNTNIYCGNSDSQGKNWCDDAGMYFYTNNDCSTFISNNVESVLNYSCQLENRSFPGIGDYVTNVNTIRNATYTIYCPVDDPNSTCDLSSDYYCFESDCSDIFEEDEEEEILDELELISANVNLPYYLKHNVISNTITKTYVCIWYNNHEFCISDDYWVETGDGEIINSTVNTHRSIANGEATEAKLKQDIESNLGITLNSGDCGSNSSTARCEFGNFLITIKSSDLKKIGLSRGESHCSVSSEDFGSGYCIY